MSSRARGLVRPVLILFALVVAVSQARAGQSIFKAYGYDQGLASTGGECLMQGPVGYLFVCSEHGVYVYDGRRFVNLGPMQGLRSGGYVDDLTATRSGRIAIAFADDVEISDRPSDVAHPPATLRFSPIRNLPPSYSNLTRKMAAWHDGLALIAAGTLWQVPLGSASPPEARPIPFTASERHALDGAKHVFAVDGRLWVTFEDGRICRAEPGQVSCDDWSNLPLGGPTFDVIAGPGGRVMARTRTAVGTRDPSSGHWELVALPDQGGVYVDQAHKFGLFVASDGRIWTQTARGLAILKDGSWREMTVSDGAPSGTIAGATVDRTGQFWFLVTGQGLMRWVGYGRVETVLKSNGLSDGMVWQTARTTDGALWVSTDTGIDQMLPDGSAWRLGHVLPGGSFALASVPRGRLWSGGGTQTLAATDPATLATVSVPLKSVNALLADRGGSGVWIGARDGVYRATDAGSGPIAPVRMATPHTEVESLAHDGAQGVYYLTEDRLRHLHADGRDVGLDIAWASTFDPNSLALSPDGTLWVGGNGGLYAVSLTAGTDELRSVRSISDADTLSNTIEAMMVDRRGWVWVGTPLGVSVSDGHRWVSITSETGLLSNDVDEGGIREDEDGSVWVTTANGLTHLKQPSTLFAARPIRALISRATVGGTDVGATPLAYSTAPLLVDFGTPDFGAERSIVFRYRLAGVDADWSETSSGAVRYPRLPPGRHVITVIAYDQLTRSASEPFSLTFLMTYPWWRQWWLETALVAAVIGAVVLLLRFRDRVALRRQRDLRRMVAEATREMRAAEAELMYRAAHDSLTGLFNRNEVQRRLADDMLVRGDVGLQAVALIDLDHFKRLNDEFGHLRGDDILAAVGQLIRAMLRPAEYAGRYGGEEMLIVLDDADGRALRRIVELHGAVRNLRRDPSGAGERLTCSIGIGWMREQDDWQSLIGRADKALYRAKRTGRDRIVESRTDCEPIRVDAPL